ncbi:hypothetical protein ACHAXA_003942 [Cyclostephanos tholiformis]|uniref:Uncharacterized protein n=1 Tax=Cyclostephanos tholiformis TaxID=382380 RepID=A0ABD3RYK0_9STRA
MPPPRSTPLAIAHPPVATSSSMTTPMCEDYGFPSSSNHACSSPQSSLESTVSTCASRQVPLTVLSRDGSPVVQRSSAWPSAAASSPLIRSLDNASLPQTAMMPTTLPSLHRSEDAGNTPRGAAKTTGLPLPKIRLTPRGGGHGLSLVHSPIMLEENDCDDHTHYGLRPTFPTKFSPIPPVGIDHPPLRSASLSSFGMGDDEVIAEMDSLLDRFGHHKASADHIQGCDLLPPHGSLPEDKADPSTRLTEEGEAVDGLDRVESEEAEMVALLNHDPTSPRRNHHCFHSRPMPSITLNLETIEGQHGLSLSKSPSFLPRPVPFVQGGTRSLFDTTKDPIEGILLADAIAEAAKSNEPLTDDEGSEFEGNHSDFLLSLPLSDHRSGDSHVAPLSSVPSLDLPQAETNLMTVRRRYSFRPRRPSVDSADVLGDPWDAIGGHVPSGAVVQEGLNKRAFSDAALRDSPSAPSSMELATSVPKYSRPNASDSDAVMLMGLGPSPSAAACSLLSMSSLCGLNIIHEMSDPSFHASTPQLPLSESPECAGAAVKLFRSEFSECSLGFSIDSNDGCVYQRDLFTPPVSMD